MTNLPFGRPLIGDAEKDAVLEVLNDPILAHGPRGKAFENEFVKFMGGGKACTVSSCMAALHLASIHFEFGPGDEVIVPAQTHVATVHAVELTGATPVFVDCEPDTGNIDTSKIEQLITKKTKAISLVHFVGIPADMPKIMEIAQRHSLKVIEDCALAVGTRIGSQHVGLFGDAGCFSFYPVKHFTTGEGGMFASQSTDTVDEVANFRAFSVDRTHSERKVPGVYDVTGVGMNYRMSEITAALGRVQLSRVGEFLEIRRGNFETLKQILLQNSQVRVLDNRLPDGQNSHYCLVVVLDQPLSEKRPELIANLNQAGIGTSIYYPQPVPRMRYYREKFGYDKALYPNAEAISDQSIALPVGPHLDRKDMERIGTTFTTLVKEYLA
jgi:perosamine synthetase